MEYWSALDYFERNDYEYFYCEHCNKIYYINDCTHTIDDQRDSVNYYKEDLYCDHCKEEVEALFTDDDDLQEWLEERVNNGDELPLNIVVETEKEHYEDDEWIKLTNWNWKK